MKNIKAPHSPLMSHLLDKHEKEREELGKIIKQLREENKRLLDAIEVLEATTHEGLGPAIEKEINRAKAIKALVALRKAANGGGDCWKPLTRWLGGSL